MNSTSTIIDLIDWCWQQTPSNQERVVAAEMAKCIKAYYHVAATDDELRELALQHTDLIEPGE